MLLAAIFGLFVGAIPGLTATMATALLVPVTFFMEPVPAIAAIVTTVAMAIFAGDIPGALLRIPGTPASAAYADEAYALTRKGQAERRSASPGGVGDRRPVRHRGADLSARRAGRDSPQVQLLRVLLARLPGPDLRGIHLHRTDAEGPRLAADRPVHRDHRPRASRQAIRASPSAASN